MNQPKPPSDFRWIEYAILAIVIAVNLWLGQRLSDATQATAATAGRLPREVAAASPCVQCRASGGCRCCRCGDAK